ncbi:MAG: non-homologous end-joining DNA ligase LigD [Nitrososphaerales archaeon]
MATISDRILLLLSIKEEGKLIGIDHIFEKVRRDILFAEKKGTSREEVEVEIRNLISQGLVERFEGGFSLSKEGDKIIEKLILEKEKELNRSYTLVWLAKKYYPHVAGLMIPFIKGRAVSAVKIFSGKKDPINEVDAIFVRYTKYKPKPVFLTIDSESKLMSLVFDHCVDFIPYVHKLDSNEPDYFILDLDAGSEIMNNPKAFDLIKYIASELSSLLTELGVESVAKFSGSRGFQVWASLDNTELKDRGDLFKAYREMAIAIQGKLEDRLQRKIGDLVAMFPSMVHRDRQITTSVVAHKEERASQVLVDWSALKPMGDVRAPFSIHYKTGLASVPIHKSEIMSFEVRDAHPLKVIEDLNRYERATKMKRCSPPRLL